MAETSPAHTPRPWQRASLPFWLATVGLALWVIGVLLPWADFALRFESPLGDAFGREVAQLVEAQFEPSTGYDLGTNIGLQPDEGKVVLVLGLGFGLVFALHLVGAVAGRVLPIAMATLAAIALLVVVGELTDLSDATDVVGVDVSIGAGIWVSLIGVVAGLAAGVAAALERGERAPGGITAP